MSLNLKNHVLSISLFFLGISLGLSLTGCERMKDDLDELKNFFKSKDHCAVVMQSELSFVEYCFPSYEELKKFKQRIPQYTDPNDPVNQYLQLKSTGAGDVVRRIKLNKSPSTVPGRGIIYSWSDNPQAKEDEFWNPERGYIR